MRSSTLGVICLLIVSLGCGSGNNALAPHFQPEVGNVTDSFQFQTTGITDITQTLQYTWRNTGTQANVDQACAISAGTGTLTIRDALNVAVYSNDLRTNGSAMASLPGATGNWTIQVNMNRVSGTLNFRVQKRP